MPYKNGILIRLREGRWEVLAFCAIPRVELQPAIEYAEARNKREGR